MRKISGIYKIEDKASGMVYVGLSTNLADRWRSHLLNFLCGQGINKYHPELKIENLSFSILELCSNDKLDEREKYWISYYNSFEKGFNRTSGGRVGYTITLPEEKEEVYIYSYPEPAIETYVNIFDFIKTLPIETYWCYSNSIQENIKIVKLANSLGFSAIELHGRNNTDYPLSGEQLEVLEELEFSGMVPDKYNFVVVNSVFSKSFKLKDTRFNQLIVNSLTQSDISLARRQTFEIQKQYCKASNEIENIYDAKQTIYIKGVAQALLDGRIRADGKHHFWCYTKYIGDILRIEMLAQQAGFNVLSLWAKDNQKYKELWTAEKTEAMTLIQKEGVIPPQYDFVIVNEVVGRSIDVVDTNYQDWICNSCVYEDVGQFIRARFSPERKYLLKSTKPTITIDVQLSKIPAIYYDWHTVPELRELLKSEPLYDDTGKAFLIWNQARKFYEDKLEFRRYGKKQVSQYRFKSSS